MDGEAADLYQQAYAAIRTTAPTEEDLASSKQLLDYMSEHFPLESDKNIKRRTVILAELRTIFRTWVKEVG